MATTPCFRFELSQATASQLAVVSTASLDCRAVDKGAWGRASELQPRSCWEIAMTSFKRVVELVDDLLLLKLPLSINGIHLRLRLLFCKF